MRLNLKLIVPALALSAVIASCGGSDNDAKKNEVTVEENNFESEDDAFVLPQPITMAQMFKDAGLQYVNGKTNPVSNKGTYSQKNRSVAEPWSLFNRSGLLRDQ